MRILTAVLLASVLIAASAAVPRPARGVEWAYEPPPFDLGILFAEVQIRFRYPPTFNYSLKPVYGAEPGPVEADHQEIASPVEAVFRAWGRGKRYTADFQLIYPNVVNDTLIVAVNSGNYSTQVLRLPFVAKRIHLQLSFTCVELPRYPTPEEVAEANYRRDWLWRSNMTQWMSGVDGWRTLVSATLAATFLLTVVNLAVAWQTAQAQRKRRGVIELPLPEVEQQWP
jgi:hypothetical protein